MASYFDRSIRPRTPATFARMHGMESLTELASMSRTHRQTLERWFVEKPWLFDLVLLGALVEKGVIVEAEK